MDSSTWRSAISENVFLFFLFHRLLPLKYVFMNAAGNQTSNRKDLQEFVKRRWKVHQRNISRETGLTFDQGKPSSENYEPISNWLWLV